MDCALVPFEDAHGEPILRWVQSREELEAWTSRTDFPLDAAVFRAWHADRDVRPYTLLVDGALGGYGEVWEDREEGEAELARIIVAARLRGRGIGRRLVGLLARDAVSRGVDEVWLRVFEWNAPAIACYRSAGFARATPEEEAAFNRGQPCSYVWMRLETPAVGS